MNDKDFEEWFKKETTTPAGKLAMMAYIGVMCGLVPLKNNEEDEEKK